MNRSTKLITLSASVTLLAINASCDSQRHSATSQPAAAATAVDVRLVPISHEPFPVTIDFTGTLFGDEEAQISSKTSGRIVEIAADLGDRLADGALIARVDPTDYQLSIQQRAAALRESLSKIGLDELPPASFDPNTVATVRRAKVQADNANARLDRAKQLFEQAQPLISPQEFADTQTQYAVAKQDFDVAVLDVKSALALAQSRAADLDAARQQLADTEIRAPRFSDANATTQPATQPATQTVGRSARWAVAARLINVGEYVTTGTVVYKLMADQPIKLRAAMPERFLNRIAVGEAVALDIDASAQSTPGTISRVSPAVDVASRTFAIEATFLNVDRKLKPGSFGRGTVTVGMRDDVSTIPAAALYSFAGIDKVFTVNDGKAVSHTVNVLYRAADRAVIEGTLDKSTAAITGGFARLGTGVAVNVTAE